MTTILLTNEFGISQSFPDVSGHGFNKPASVIVFALVESERLFVQIPETDEKVRRLHKFRESRA